MRKSLCRERGKKKCKAVSIHGVPHRIAARISSNGRGATTKSQKPTKAPYSSKCEAKCEHVEFYVPGLRGIRFPGVWHGLKSSSTPFCLRSPQVALDFLEHIYTDFIGLTFGRIKREIQVEKAPSKILRTTNKIVELRAIFQGDIEICPSNEFTGKM